MATASVRTHVELEVAPSEAGVCRAKRRPRLMTAPRGRAGPLAEGDVATALHDDDPRSLVETAQLVAVDMLPATPPTIQRCVTRWT